VEIQKIYFFEFSVSILVNHNFLSLESEQLLSLALHLCFDLCLTQFSLLFGTAVCGISELIAQFCNA